MAPGFVNSMDLFKFIGYPLTRDTTQDGKYESGVRERVNLTPMPGRPARGESPNITIDLGTVFF